MNVTFQKTERIFTFSSKLIKPVMELRLLDHFKFTSRISTSFACSYSEDDRIYIVSDTGVYVLALKVRLDNPFPTFSSKNDFFAVSNYVPGADVDIDINSFHKDLSRFDLYTTAMSVELSSNLNNAAAVTASPADVQWSPRGIVGKTDCLLGVLSNFHSLELYVKYVNEDEITEYRLVTNLTKELVDLKKPQWKYANRLPPTLKLNELKKRVRAVSCTAFVWSHLYQVNDADYCAVFMGHMNGDISVWKIAGRESNSKEQSKACFIGCYSTSLGSIVRLHWHHTKEYGGGLSFADSDGRMSVLHVKDLHLENASMDNELAFWTEPDKVSVDKITVMVHEASTYIILVKQSFLIIYALSELGEVFDQKICNVEELYITGIHHFRNTILVLTMVGTLKQYTLSIAEKRIRLEAETVRLKIDMPKYRTHGFFFSKNLMLFGLVAYPFHLRSFAKLKTYLNVFIFHNNALNPLEALWGNPTGSLRDYWDCFEALRLICLKDKRFPWLGLPSTLNYDDLSLTRLKTLRWLAQLSEMVYSTVPVIRNYNIKPFVILHYLVQIKLVVKRLDLLLNLHGTGTELSVFQKRSLEIQNFFLKEMVAKNVLAKANVGRGFIGDMRRVMGIANELRYPDMVQCIIGPVCVPPHADSRCSLTMMPIFLVPGYKCPFCKALAHKEIEKQQDVFLCPYCDVPMEKLCTPQTSSALEDGERVTSTCFEDCLKEEVSFSDVEENENEYLVLSDDEEEPGEKLKELYARFKSMSVEEVLRADCADAGNSESSEAGPSRKMLKLEGAG
ncbi:hypothetical protein NQ315_001399 [Exocentrus adspersus]|uniref:Transcription factor IIIC 90kDa subunit N-terminal domain-containing protein n=1 Tax=Exocentrus adspersus TaxID=1586481 RepID=A0AAV8WFL6_9CUCU|nr:hypothetical protein NQ315_001399 [Exocentrus adspersus]